MASTGWRTAAIVHENCSRKEEVKESLTRSPDMNSLDELDKKFLIGVFPLIMYVSIEIVTMPFLNDNWQTYF